jgi:serine/threonine protein kinase
MTPEELGLIRRIYEEALPMDGASQEAFIRTECEGRGDLEAEVHRLIQAHGNVPAWLDQPVLGSSPASNVHEPKLEGRVIGGYTLTRELGRGGMGTVYLAERSDGVFHRQAAIKLVLPPFNTAAMRTRFQQEREILASLDHPNIARLLDAGTTAEGWPYFVMEYVEGKPINVWCDEKELNITQRIQLFRDVIQAVDYAHRHLVVHRDLKPANILVTNSGTVKLLDFGIAKLLASPTLDESAATTTLAGMMTLFYASPEQVRGAPITTQSDVYSLGVVFYELLTGHRPYRLAAAASHEIARVIAEVDPARPSDVITQPEAVTAPGDMSEMTPEHISISREGNLKRLRSRLRGDLDAIVLKALRKEPDRRYGSVVSFAEDLERHLERRPILAREASVLERLTRSVMREPPLFAGISVLIALLWVGLGTVVQQTREEVEAATRNPAARISFRSLWFFEYALCMFALPVSVYIARITRHLSVLSTRRGKRQRAGGLVGGLIWGLGITLTWRLAGAEGWWHSRIPGHADPLRLTSPQNVLIYCVLGGTVTWWLYMSGQKLGRRGTGIALVLLGLGTAAVQRIAFGYIIPALAFDGGAVSILSTAAISAAAGWIGLTVMRLIGGAERERAV